MPWLIALGLFLMPGLAASGLAYLLMSKPPTTTPSGSGSGSGPGPASPASAPPSKAPASPSSPPPPPPTLVLSPLPDPPEPQQQAELTPPPEPKPAPPPPPPPPTPSCPVCPPPAGPISPTPPPPTPAAAPPGLDLRACLSGSLLEAVRCHEVRRLITATTALSTDRLRRLTWEALEASRRHGTSYRFLTSQEAACDLLGKPLDCPLSEVSEIVPSVAAWQVRQLTPRPPHLRPRPSPIRRPRLRPLMRKG